MSARQRRIFIIALALLVVGLAINSIRQALPPRLVVIETGPVGGSYHDSAVRYASKLQAAGLKTEIRPNPQSMQIVNNLQQDKPRIDIGFAVQALNAASYTHVVTAGIVELQPLFIFYNKGLAKVSSLATLRGKRLVMPAQNSATADTVRALLSRYDITEKNTPFTYLPIAEAAAALKSGQYDAGFFMLASTNKMIVNLISADNLSLLPLPEAVGISRQLEHLKAGVIPMGSYDLNKNLPNTDIAVVGGLVNVVVRKDIHPAVLYGLLDAMKDTHQGQSLVSAKGEFPSATGTTLPLHPLVGQWVKSGTPWIYANFSPVFASLIDKYWLLALAMLLMAEVYKTLRYVYELIELGASATALRVLSHIRRGLSMGRKPGLISRKLFAVAEKIIRRESQDKKGIDLLEQIRPLMNAS